jgi:phosphinothricin acetyltransferase
VDYVWKETGMKFAISEMQKRDWTRVRAIYREGLATGLAAFMSVPPVWKDWDSGHLAVGRLVARADNSTLAGWAALAPVPDT